MVQECQHTGDFFSDAEIARAGQSRHTGEQYQCGTGHNAVAQQGFVAGNHGCGSGGADCTGAEHTTETRAALLAMLQKASVELNIDGTVRSTPKPDAPAARPTGRVHPANQNLSKFVP